MRLKRIYNWDAPRSEWTTRYPKCTTCNGKAVVVNKTGDGLADCPDCEHGVQRESVPPVSGVEVLHAGPEQHFSPRIIDQGQAEGWLSIASGKLTIHGENRTLVYDIVRPPGTYDGERINYYDCVLLEGEED